MTLNLSTQVILSRAATKTLFEKRRKRCAGGSPIELVSALFEEIPRFARNDALEERE